MIKIVGFSRIIGFTGRKRSGKDTAAKAYPDYESVSFAKPLKMMVATLLRYRGATEAQIAQMIEGDLKETPTPLLNGRTPRYAMQTLGTEWGRQLMADSLWVDSLVDVAKRHDKVVVTDVRFANEVTALRNLGAKIIRISRERVAMNDNHPSEAEIDQLVVDEEIVNDGTVEELKAKVRPNPPPTVIKFGVWW